MGQTNDPGKGLVHRIDPFFGLTDAEFTLIH
jgi:hypothetical protein